MQKAALFAAGALAALLAIGSPVEAQIVKGRVVTAGTESPLVDVSIKLRAPDGRILASGLTNELGEFRLHSSRISNATILAERIGLQSVTTAPVQVALSQVIDVQIQMSETAVPLEPLTVRAREYFDLGPLSGYFERVQRHERMGFGHVLTRDQLQERDAIDVVDILRELPRIAIVQQPGRGQHVMFRGGALGQCTPRVYINGVYANRNTLAYIDELVRPTELEGIEVYRGLAEMPGEFYDETHCGVILVWTRRDAEGGRPFAWKRVLLTIGGIAAVSFVLFR